MALQSAFALLVGLWWVFELACSLVCASWALLLLAWLWAHLCLVYSSGFELSVGLWWVFDLVCRLSETFRRKQGEHFYAKEWMNNYIKNTHVSQGGLQLLV
jgi:hypothetical protein